MSLHTVFKSLNRVGRRLTWPAFGAWMLLGAYSHAGEMRVFHSADGKPLKASFEGFSGDKIKLRREDGKTFELTPDKLSAADQAYVKQAASQAGDDAKKLNEAAGHEITDGSPLAGRKAEDLAGALKLRPESKSKYGQSWRLYAAFAPDYQLFGAMPYSVALYSGEDGLVTNISIVYANKGDFGSTAGFGKDHFKGGTTATANTLDEAMARDEENVTKALTAVLGPPTEQRFGEGDTRRKIRRWDWNGHSFLLSNEEGEYVGLAIVSTESADGGGKSARVKDGDVKQRLLDSVVKSDNGDVYLSEIPMVDQGPKGYCVPATFERAMRTMGLEADMYLLAMVGESKAGGGTSVETAAGKRALPGLPQGPPDQGRLHQETPHPRCQPLHRPRHPRDVDAALGGRLQRGHRREHRETQDRQRLGRLRHRNRRRRGKSGGHPATGERPQPHLHDHRLQRSHRRNRRQRFVGRALRAPVGARLRRRLGQHGESVHDPAFREIFRKTLACTFKKYR